MRMLMLGALAMLLAGAGLATADHGTFGGMSVFDKWKQRGCTKCAAPCCEPCCVPTYMIPPPKLFRAEVEAPTYGTGKPLPPIQLIRAVPPGIELVGALPPPLPLVHAAPAQVELVAATPPPVQLFRRQSQPAESAPSIKLPSVKLFRIAQPATPCCPPPICAPCGATCVAR